MLCLPPAAFPPSDPNKQDFSSPTPLPPSPCCECRVSVCLFARGSAGGCQDPPQPAARCPRWAHRPIPACPSLHPPRCTTADGARIAFLPRAAGKQTFFLGGGGAGGPDNGGKQVIKPLRLCCSACLHILLLSHMGRGGSPVLRAVRRGCHESTAKHGLLVRLLTLERNDGGAEGSRSSCLPPNLKETALSASFCCLNWLSVVTTQEPGEQQGCFHPSCSAAVSTWAWMWLEKCSSH